MLYDCIDYQIYSKEKKENEEEIWLVIGRNMPDSDNFCNSSGVCGRSLPNRRFGSDSCIAHSARSVKVLRLQFRKRENHTAQYRFRADFLHVIYNRCVHRTAWFRTPLRLRETVLLLAGLLAFTQATVRRSPWTGVWVQLCAHWCDASQHTGCVRWEHLRLISSHCSIRSDGRRHCRCGSWK